MGNKLRHEGDEVRIKVIWPDIMFKKQIFRYNPVIFTGNIHTSSIDHLCFLHGISLFFLCEMIP